MVYCGSEDCETVTPLRVLALNHPLEVLVKTCVVGVITDIRRSVLDNLPDHVREHEWGVVVIAVSRKELQVLFHQSEAET